MEAYAARSLLQTMQRGFGLGECICQRCYFISLVRVPNSFVRGICLSLRRKAIRVSKTAHYDWSMLNNLRYLRLICDNTKKQIPCTSETPTLNDKYENFVNVPMEAAAECIPTNLKANHRLPWETLIVKKT